MADEEILARIGHAFDRNEAAFDRNTAAFEKFEAFYARSMKDWREFTHEIMLRVERLGRDEIRALSRMTDELHDLGLESRAQTEALWRVIDRMDRLDGGSPPAPA